MVSFPLTHLYGMTRDEYYKATGVTAEELVRHLKAEVLCLSTQRDQVRKLLRKKPFASSEGRYLSNLYKEITNRIDRKERKIKEIEK